MPSAAAPFPVVTSALVVPDVPGPSPAGHAVRLWRPHTGGWEGRPGVVVVGDDRPDALLPGLASCGAVAVALDGPLPAGTQEALALVQTALAWARRSACDLGFDPDFLGVLGTGSAGWVAPWVALVEGNGDAAHSALAWAAALVSAPWPSGLPIFLPDDRPVAALPRLWIGQVDETPGDGRSDLRNWVRAYLVAGGDAELEVFSGTDAAVCACVSRVADFLARQAPAGLVPFASA
jgi:hypothetical protein